MWQQRMRQNKKMYSAFISEIYKCSISPKKSWISLATKIVTISSIATAFLSSCLEEGSDFSPLDKKGGQGEGIGRCEIKQLIPSNASTIKVSGSSTGHTQFSTVITGTDCSIKYYLNGSTTPLTSSGNNLILSSSLLNAGPNQLRVEVTGPIGSDFRVWNLEKNTLPTCTMSSPLTPNLNIVQNSAPVTLSILGNGGDPGETLTYSWLLNGQSSNTFQTCNSLGNFSSCQWDHSTLDQGPYEIKIRVYDGIDEAFCTYNVNLGPDCTISSKSPSATNHTWPANSTSPQTLSVNTSDSSCLVSWTINGNPVVGSGASRNFYSGELATGSNIIKASVSSSIEATWIVVKNTPPSCNQSPAPTPTPAVSVGGSLPLSAILTDSNGHTLTWNWLKGSTPITSGITNTSNSTTWVFNPAASDQGIQDIKIAVDDGFDTTICQWSVNVTPACSILSSLPGTNSFYVSAIGTAQTMFAVTPSNASECNINWEVNDISYGSGSSKIISASVFSPGIPHTVKATVSNAGSSDTKTWTVWRNNLPTCSSQTPIASGLIIAENLPQTFSLTVADPDPSQTYTYDWKLNGTTPPFSPSSSGLTTQATWTPLSGNLGVNNISVEVKNYYDASQFDTHTCAWSTTVLPPCNVADKSPLIASIKVPYNPSHQTAFSAVSNHPSCSISWELNGNNVGSGNFYNLQSSALNSGTNAFKAKLTNAISNTEFTWNVTKNIVHSCSSQSPAGSATINVGSSQAFVGNMSNPDGDSLFFDWTLASTPLLGEISNSLNLSPNLSQVGSNQLLRLRAFDGYDEAFCDWTVTINDPNTATILAWNPTSDPVVILSTDSQNFSVTATGTGLTYKWYLDNVLLTGRSGASETFTYLDIAPGAVRELKVVVTDTYNNTAQKIFNVKRNQKPVINSTTPSISGSSTYRTNIGVPVSASVSASDPDGDTLTYTWTLNNTSNTSHPSGILSHDPNPSLATTATFNPSNNSLYLGTQQLRVVVSDGHESVTHLWPISVNYFSTTCNNLYNSPVSSSGGKVCTLVGNPSIGHNEDVILDPTRLKISPNHVIELEPNVYAYADGYYHVIGIVNDTNSSKSYFGQTIPPGQMKIVLGVGQRGRNLDASSYTSFWGVNASGENYPNFKIFDPSHLTYDPSGVGVLYIADRGNNRVLALVNSSSRAGQVIRVLGLANGSTSATANEGLGINTSCGAPSGVAINIEGSNKFLYVTCSSQHQIKKVDITDFTGSNIPNFNTVIAVGRLASNNQPTNTDSFLDGHSGGAFNPNTGGVARTTTPWGLFAHNGLVFFSDQTKRIRVLNTNSSTVDLYPDFESQIDKFISTNLIFQAAFLSTPPGTSAFNNIGSLGLNASLISSDTVDTSKYILHIPSNRVSGACHAVTIHPRNTSSNYITASIVLNPTVNSTVAGTLFNNPECSGTGTNSLTVNIPQGRSLGTFWVKTSSNLDLSITGVTGNKAFNSLSLTNGTSSDTTGTFYSFVTSPSSGAGGFHPLDCLPIELRISKTNSVSAQVINMTSTFQMSMFHNNIGTFYADQTCTTPVSRITLSSGPAIRTVFYRRDVKIPPSWVASVFGSGAPLNTATNYSSSVGTAVYSSIGYWLAPHVVSGNLNGIIYNPIFNNTNLAALPLQHSVSYLNFTNQSQNVGVTIAPYSSASIANSVGGLAGYINDNVTASTTRFNSVKGLFVSHDQHAIVSDFANRRVRKVELFSTNGQVKPALGLGRTRDRSNDMSAEAFQANLAYPYKLEYLNQRLYFSELWNHRIRYVDLNTGLVSTAAGIGYGTTFFDGNDATAEPMMNPRGFKIIPWPNHTSPTHYVLIYAQPYQIRAVNLSSTVLNNFFGVNLLPGKVRTIAGNNASTSEVTGWGTNTEGMNAIGAIIRQAYDVAFIKGEIYFLDFNDQCLLRVTQNGKLYQVNPGTCNTTPTTTDGEFGDFVSGTPPASFRLNRPVAFGDDASFPGNYFVLGNYYDSNSRLYYINSLATDIMFFGFGSPRTGVATTNIAHASWLYNVPTFTGSARAQAVTSWAQNPGSVGSQDRICWATGDYDQTGGSFPGATNGEHSIYCTVRTSASSPNIVAGQGMGPGGPIGLDQEGLSATTASFYGPTGMVFDEEGNLYVADSGNHIIRMIRRWWP